MARSNPASGTAVSATSTPDDGLPSALSRSAVQDPSIPTPGSCHIDKCAIETLIQVAEGLGCQGQCDLSRVSKRFSEAAQDVLYRFVDIRPCDQKGLYYDKSAISQLLWTFIQKPHLATKVRDLWFLPRGKPVQHRIEQRMIQVYQTRLACDLLIRLHELRSLTITTPDSRTCFKEYHIFCRSSDDSNTIFGKLPIRPERLLSLSCFSKLTSLFLSHGHLDWAIVTSPTLHTLCLGSDATVQSPANEDDDAEAPKITSFTFEVHADTVKRNYWRAIGFFVRLPNVRSLTLGSCLWQEMHHRFSQPPIGLQSDCVFSQLGFFSLSIVRAFLANGPSIEELTFTYGENAYFSFNTTVRLDVTQFEQLRRIQSAESALVDSPYFQRPAKSGPSDLLPPYIQTLVITHPTSPEEDDEGRKLKLTSWLGELTRTEFPDFERVEVVQSVGFGDDVGFMRQFEQSEEIQQLRAIGVTVVVRKG